MALLLNKAVTLFLERGVSASPRHEQGWWRQEFLPELGISWWWLV